MAKRPQKREPLVVASKMKAYIRGQGMMSSSEAVEAISEHVYNMLDAAIARAKANRRSTVRAQDL
jgi:hypothetical protein